MKGWIDYMPQEIFMSIIIPTYNPRQFLPQILGSIAKNKHLDRLEVILSDDCSSEPFEDVLEQFKMLNIRIIKNDEHKGFPRCGRQHGADEAKGEWFTFADQDDYYVPYAFDDIITFIKSVKAKNYITSDFIEESVETGEQIVRNRFKGWTHGKFYEKKFWVENGICYDNVDYCEDINLSVKLDCLVTSENIKTFEYDKPLYIWRRRKDSLASIEYFIKSMPDYITATLGVTLGYVEKYKNLENKQLTDAFYIKFLATFLHIYFYFQSHILNDKKQVLLESVSIAQPIWTRFKEVSGFTNADIINFFNGDLMWLYQKTRNDDYSQIPFIEQLSFADWLTLYFD